jgi:hypothetical protein
MKATWKAGLVIGAVVLATLAIGVVQTKADKDTPDLTGTWTLDPAKSDLPAGGQLRRWGGGGGGGFGGHGGGGHGSWQGRGGGGDNPGDGGHGRGGWGGGNGLRAGGGGRLPRILHITQASTAILFADSAGAAFQEIQIGASPAPNSGHEGDGDQFRHLSGHWASGTLEVERVSPRGGVMLQKYKLEDHGKTLEVRMERKGSGDGSSDAPQRAPREFKMVYRRTA